MKIVYKQSDIKTTIINEKVSRKVLAYGPEIMAVEVFFDKDGQGAVHAHPHAQTTYIISGEFEFTVDGVAYIVTKGDTLYFAPNVAHGTLCIEAGSVLDSFTPYREDFVNGQ